MSRRGVPYVDPRQRRSVIYSAYARLVGTRAMSWLSRTVVWKLDPLLLQVSRGRVGLGLLLPMALLKTCGARTGRPRRNGVMPFAIGSG